MFRFTSPTSRCAGDRRKYGSRNAAATVELAIVLPVLMVLVFGSLEVCYRMFTKQAVVIVAYETARAACRKNAVAEDVAARCMKLLESQNIKAASVQIRDLTHGENNLDKTKIGDTIRVRIQVPWGPNTISRMVVTDQGQFVVDAVMLRE